MRVVAAGACGGGIGDVPLDPESHCMREGAAPLDPLQRGLLVLPPPLVLSSPFPRGTAVDPGRELLEHPKEACEGTRWQERLHL